jgi:hypothetical protein
MDSSITFHGSEEIELVIDMFKVYVRGRRI